MLQQKYPSGARRRLWRGGPQSARCASMAHWCWSSSTLGVLILKWKACRRAGELMMLQQKYPSESAVERGTPVGQKRQHGTLVLVEQHLGSVSVELKGMPACRRAHDAPAKIPFRARRRLRTGGTPVGQKRQHCTLVLVKQHLGSVGVTEKGMPAGRRAHDAPTKVPFRARRRLRTGGTPVGQKRQHCTLVLVKQHLGSVGVT